MDRFFVPDELVLLSGHFHFSAYVFEKGYSGGELCYRLSFFQLRQLAATVIENTYMIIRWTHVNCLVRACTTEKVD